MINSLYGISNVTVSLNGNPYTSGQKIRDEGDYRLKVDAEDKAGNAANESFIKWTKKFMNILWKFEEEAVTCPEISLRMAI